MSSDQNAIFRFDNTYRRLPDRFHARLMPTPAPEPRLIKLNKDLAQTLGLDPETVSGEVGARIFSGSSVPDGAEPLAMAYAGHQFGSFVPQLGDGRALLLGEVIDRASTRRDIQLKGSGPTPFSRGGDGFAAVGPVLREYIVSEAMHTLGIPTTRSLAVATTGNQVFRDTILPGAVLTRVASSHIRVGTFQYFAARGDNEALSLLSDYVINRHYPHVRNAENPLLALIEAVMDTQARLVSLWMSVGFIHGVMNTDNMTLSGETIDYGPCAFMDDYDEAKVFSSIDQFGRYAYSAQPQIAHWNLARLAETLLPLIDSVPEKAVERANKVIVGFGALFEKHWTERFRAKLGFAQPEDGDGDLIRGFLSAMQTGKADFTLAFRRLSDAVNPRAETDLTVLFDDASALKQWLPLWRARLDRESRSDKDRSAAMRAVNPLFIPRNHRVEQVIEAAVTHGDFKPFETLVDVLANPFEEQPVRAAYADPPQSDEIVQRTFCGT